MKVEYPLHLFNNFNKQIWTNKTFSYFLIVIIIGYTIGLRNYPEIYYKYLYNPLILLILICYILLIAKYNIPLGFMLTFSIIVLYYPKIKNNNSEIMETFENENEDDKINVPVYGEDKNIVDDTKKINKNKKDIKIAEDFKNKDKDEKDEKEDDEDDDDETEQKEKFTEDNDEVKEIGLEKLNPTYYKNKKNNANNNSKSKKNNNLKKKSNSNSNSNNTKEKNQPQPTKESETFIGDVRQVIRDLDTGRGGMNASNAIKQINNLFYDKHKLNIKKIIEDDDDSEEESDDDDFF